MDLAVYAKSSSSSSFAELKFSLSAELSPKGKWFCSAKTSV